MSFNKDFFQQLLESRKFIFPILLTISLTAVFTVFVNNALIYTETEPQDIAPVTGPDDVASDPVGTVAAGLSNALIYVFIALVGGFLLVFLIRTGKIKILELLFASMMGFATFTFGYYVFWTIPYWIFIYFPSTVDLISLRVAVFILNEFMLLLSLIFGILSFLVLGLNRFRSQKMHNSLMILFGSLMGVVFGINFGTISLFFVLLALAVYDIYAVFWGPIKKMFTPINNENIKNSEENSKNSNEFQITYNDAVEHEKKLRRNCQNCGILIEKNELFCSGCGYEILNETNLSEVNENTQDSKNIVYPQKNSRKKEEYVEYQTIPISLPVYHTPEISIGLGDFVFFSVLISKSFYEGMVNNNMWLFLLPFLGILFGSYITFRMLEKYEILPALPIPILAGTVGFILALFLGYIPNLL